MNTTSDPLERKPYEPKTGKPPKAAKPPAEPKAPPPVTLDITEDLTIRVNGLTGPAEFASRSALEDVLTAVLRWGAALGWTSGRHELTETGVVIDDKEIVRNADGRMVAVRTRRRVERLALK